MLLTVSGSSYITNTTFIFVFYTTQKDNKKILKKYINLQLNTLIYLSFWRNI